MKWFLIFLFFLVACQPRPVSLKSVDFVKSNPGNGLWIALRTGMGGNLVRLDKEKQAPSKIKNSHIQSDVLLLPDQDDQLFMLTRFRSDSIQILKGVDAKLFFETALPKGALSGAFSVPFNPQYALRDKFERVWVVGQNSNDILIYSKDLLTLENTINLEKLGNDFFITKDGSDYYLEPAILTAPNEDEIVLFIQRLRRYFNDSWDWVPTKNSVMVVFNTNDFSVRKIKEVPTSNPIKAFVNNKDGWPVITLVGAGSMNDYPIMASKSEINTKDYTISKVQQYPFKILDADQNMMHELAYIAWYKDQGYSCVVIKDEERICSDADQGYVYNKILFDETHAYVSHLEQGSGNLLILDNNDSNNIKTIPMMGIIESMVFGE